MNAINFQSSNFNKNATSGMTLSLSSIMIVSVIECPRVISIVEVNFWTDFLNTATAESSFYGNLNK